MLPLAQDVLVQESDLWARMGTIATLAAVLVALFGPLLVDWLRRPRLEVSVASDLISTLAGAPAETGRHRLTVNISNQGRRQANDVQVFLSVEAPVEIPGESEIYGVEAFQSPTPFFHQEGGKWTFQYSVAIPPGFSRPLHLLAEDGTGFRLVSAVELDSAVASPHSHGLDDGDHRVVLDIVGSNFKVVRLEGWLEVENNRPQAVARWKEAPKVVPYRAADPLPS